MIVLFGLFIVIGCSKKYQLENQIRISLKFAELPDTIKSIYLESIEPRELLSETGGVSVIYYRRKHLICIDDVLGDCEYKLNKTGPWIDNYLFSFGSKQFRLDYNNNTMNEPYILYKGELYYRITRNMRNIDDVKGGAYGKFDLKSYFQ